MARAGTKENVKKAKAALYRNLIVQAAEEVFANCSYEEAKIQDIAQQAGIALGTLYTVFPSKQAIYAAIQKVRGREILDEVAKAVAGRPDILDAVTHAIDAYVHCMTARPNYLRMHLRDDLSWTQRSVLRTGEQVETWEEGMKLATSLLAVAMKSGRIYDDNPPEVLIKMMIATQQVQLSDWLERGAERSEIEALIARMQAHFARAFIRAEPALPKRSRSSR